MLSPGLEDFCVIDPAEKANLIVVIDTEEEFNWSLEKLQFLFDEYRILPVYVVDYLVAFQPDGYRPLQEIYNSGRGLIGAHLHPWVNPPFESVTSSLGFKPFPHEGKIVRLAAYGDPEILLDTILSRFDQEPGNFRIRESNNIYFSRYLATLFPKIDVAAAYQRALEVVATNYVRHYVQQTGIPAVVFCGG